MLMQNFKSAHELGISEPQFDALRKTLVLMETGKLFHVPAPHVPLSDMNPHFTGRFNMAAWCRDSDCGTVCCIGGTAEIIGHVNFSDRDGPLDDLFYGKGLPPEIHLSQVTPDQAARALRSYLTTGDAKWSEAVA